MIYKSEKHYVDVKDKCALGSDRSGGRKTENQDKQFCVRQIGKKIQNTQEIGKSKTEKRSSYYSA